MSFKINLRNLLDVDIHFSKGYYSTDNILVSKGDRVHTMLIAIVGFFGFTYTIIGLIQAYHYQAILSFSCGIFALIAWLIHRKGYTLASKLVNFIQLIAFIALMFYFPSSPYGEHINDSVLAFYVPVLIGTLIAFQEKQRIYGRVLAVIILLLISLLVLTDIHYPEHEPVAVLNGANFDMLINIIGAAAATFAEVAYILALNDRLNNSLIKTNHELDNFIYIVSHDLRSPLLSTKGLIDLAKMKIDDREQVLKYLGLAGKSINNLDQIIHEILTYSRNARTEIQEEEFELKDVVKEIFDGLRFSAGPGFSFQEEYSGETKIYADKNRLSTVLRNIISNSVKYKKKEIENPFVFLRFENNNHHCSFSITDNGEGIPLECQPRVFEMFYRGTSSATGTGLGLYICKEMLDKMDVLFAISSKPGEGTTFNIQLKKIATSLVKEKKAPALNPAKQSGSPTASLKLNEQLNSIQGLSSFNQAG
ncbi:MAG TPA: HAMP domain-containing sensor histidine kinase [Chitinophagaceae bacterium]|nr:HAMP domain-containing sensor histidine kinase [Chitinophagaceae bacterium]HPN60219.1 HAMP domain-containing sensor histidine kinase [Chitinophagaceae bacterium]